MTQLFDKWNWQPPPHWTKIMTIDMHTGGEPLRVFTSGLPPIVGKSVLEKRRYFRDHYDHVRTATMWEPRGHADMYGAVLTPSFDADLDVFFLHNEGYSTMCGHAIIALTKLVLETGLIRKGGNNPELMINVPAGRISARAVVDDGKVQEVTFRNVPSFVLLENQDVKVTDFGRVRFTVAFGGAFYAFVAADSLGLELVPDHFSQLIDLGRRIKKIVADSRNIKHPFEDDLSFLYGTIFTGPAHHPGNHSRHVCIFADGELDRSATGTGVSARAAILHENGELGSNERITNESILGSTMSVEVVETTTFGPYQGVVPEVSGTAYIIGQNEFYFDPEDPLICGFILR
jgi:trans-L-3-hydroxyproline dehydratase